MALGFEFCGSRGNVWHLELDASLRDRYVGGPLVLAEARLRGFAQRPQPEMLRAAERAGAGVVVALEWQLEPFTVEALARPQVGDDRGESCNEENVHRRLRAWARRKYGG